MHEERRFCSDEHSLRSLSVLLNSSFFSSGARRDRQVATRRRAGRGGRRWDQNERDAAGTLDGGLGRETSQGGAFEDGARGSNHTEKGEREGTNKQQSQWESDKDRLDSGTTGRVQCDERETDVPDKAE